MAKNLWFQKVPRTIAIRIALTTGLLVGCNESQITENDRVPDFGVIGKYHSEGLSQSYDYLKSNFTGNKFSMAKAFDLNMKASINFFNENFAGLRSEDKKNIIGYLERINERVTRAYAQESLTSNGRIQDINQEMLNEAAQYMTTTQKVLVNDVFAAVDQYQSDMWSLNLRLNEVESQASTLPSEESSVVLSAVATARSSADYWNANLSVWENLDPNNIPQPYRTSGKVNWNWVVGADVAAAVTTGVGFWYFNVVPLWGWAAYIAAVSTATVIVSGATAIIHIVNGTGQNGSGFGSPRVPIEQGLLPE